MMTSVQVSSQDLLLFQESLANAINNISLNRISAVQAKALAEEAVKGIYFSNSALNHKGVNWFTRRIVNAYSTNTLRC